MKTVKRVLDKKKIQKKGKGNIRKISYHPSQNIKNSMKTNYLT